MASNPMQRQARNSFLLGMLVAIIIAAVIIVFLFMQMKKLREDNQEYEANLKSIYVLAQDVKSGDVLTDDMFKKVTIMTDSIPEDYADIDSLLSAYSLYTKDGTRIISGYTNGEQHLYLDNDKKTEVFQNDETEKYYIKNANNADEYIETTEAPVLVKIDTKANTMITQSMISRSDEIVGGDVRQVEYNTIVLPIDLMTGDYIDVRLMLPSGQNVVVVSKKRVTIPQFDGEYLADTVQMNLSEHEILTMSSAIVEDWMLQGTGILYATKYVEAGMQEEASPTYVPNGEVTRLMDSDPNISNRARTELIAKYNGLSEIRNNYINSALSTYGSTEGLSGRADSSIGATLEARQEYLQSLVGE